MALATTLLGCSAALGPDDSDAAYAPNHVLEIQIEIASADWEALRMEKPPSVQSPANHGPACLPHNNPGFAYTTYAATVTLDGEVLEDVGIRKRTWCGSQNIRKPALKLDFNELVPKRRWHDLKGLTLNNSVQDASYMRQCLAYRVFKAAGVPASRCSFAHVTVNGADLGVYVNVEPVTKPYIRRNLEGDSGDGAAYKGFLADFTPDLVPYFEKELAEDDPDRSDLDDAAAALADDVSDANVADSIARVIDLDNFYAYWATEVVVAHQDGYAGNTNNFLVYHADDGRFRFMPWGVDGTFGTFSNSTAYAKAIVPSRLCASEAGANDYAVALARVLADAWDESSLLAEIDRMEALLAPVVLQSNFLVAVDEVRAFIDGRRTALDAALATAVACKPAKPATTGQLDVTFATTWGTLSGDPFASGTATFAELVLANTKLVVSQAGAVAGEADGDPIARVFARLDDTTIIVVHIPLGGVTLAPATDLTVPGVILRDAGTGAMPVASFTDATLRLTAAGTAPGAAFAGRLVAAY